MSKVNLPTELVLNARVLEETRDVIQAQYRGMTESRIRAIVDEYIREYNAGNRKFQATNAIARRVWEVYRQKSGMKKTH